MLRRNWLIPLAAGCLLAAAVVAAEDEGSGGESPYTLTYVAEAGGILVIDTVDNAALDSVQSYEVTVNGDLDQNIKVTATPNDGYRFSTWDDGITGSSRNVSSDREDVTSNTTFTASFVKTYVLTYTAGANGKIRVGENENTAPVASYKDTVNSNSSGLTVEAVPDEGYHFVTWSDGFTEAERTIVATRDTSVTATFAINTYTLTYEAGSGGKLQVGGVDVETPYSVSRDHGESGPAVTAVAITGNHFVEWSDGSTATTRADEAVRSTSFTASFAPNSTKTISSFEELKKIGKDAAYPLDGNYELTDHIDASPSRDGGAGFKPIGFAYSINSIFYNDGAFSGTFDGKGFKVTGLYINRPANDSGTGLFGYAYQATIKNVTVIADSVAGLKYVGALVGRASGSTIEGCYTNGRVTGDSAVGGLVGAVGGGKITGCYTSTAVSGKNTLGGLAGSNGMSCKITKCYSSGTVTGTGDVAGGLVGYNDFEIQDSYSTATVNGKNRVGGFVGESHYNTMNVVPGGSNTITQCYSAGLVTGESSVGGFVGLNDNSSTIRSCNWDKDVSGQTSAGSGAGASVTGKTTAKMSVMGDSAIIKGWDLYGASWGIANSYPYLISLPTNTITFTAVTQGSETAAGRVSGKSNLEQIVNRGVNGVPVVAAVSYYKIPDTQDSVQAGDSLVGWYREGEKIVAGANARLSGDTLALSGLTGNVNIEARFALKKYTRTYRSRIGSGSNAEYKKGGKIKITIGGTVIATEDSVSITRDYGTVVNVEAIPDPGYRLLRWSPDSDDLAVRTDIVAGTVKVEAVFELQKYRIKYTAENNGKLIVDDNENDKRVSYTFTNLTYNDVGRKIKAVPNTGYEFAGWSDGVTTAERQDTIKCTIDVTATFKVKVSVLEPGRNIPPPQIEEEAVVLPPVVIVAGEFTAGPNPVLKQSGIVNFYRQGRRVAACDLRIYDVAGNIINKVKISDNVIGSQSRRKVGSWDLKDAKGRPVSEGTYLVKGVIKTSDGKNEKISLILSVR